MDSAFGLIMLTVMSVDNNAENDCMLVTDFGGEICWWQVGDVDDGFGHFCHESLNIRAGNQL